MEALDRGEVVPLAVKVVIAIEGKGEEVYRPPAIYLLPADGLTDRDALRFVARNAIKRAARWMRNKERGSNSHRD
jgi:hypothetical protein